MKELRYLLLGLFVVLTLVAAGCGGGGGGGTPAPGVADKDGDGVPDADDAFPNDPTRFAALTKVPLPALTAQDPSYAVAVNNAQSPLVVGLAVSGTEVRGVRWTVTGTDSSAPVALTSLAGSPSQLAAAYGVNDHGVIVGEAETATGTVAAFWPAEATAASALSLVGMNGTRSAAYSINSDGRVVGEAEQTADVYKPVLWTSTGADPIVLETLGGAAGAAYFISDGGWIVGESQTAEGVYQATLWTISVLGLPSDPVELDALPAHARSVALGVDNSGNIVGESEAADGTVAAVLWRKVNDAYVPTNLGSAASAQAINDENRIIGYSGPGPVKAAVWDSRLSNAAGFNAILAGQSFSQAYGINQNNVVVGTDNHQAFAAVPQ